MKHTSMLAVLLSGFLVFVSVGLTHARTGAPAGLVLEEHEALGGIWELNRDRSRIPDPAALPEEPMVGPGGSGRVATRGGEGGGVRIGGGGGGARVDPHEVRAIANYVRTLNEASDRLTIVVHKNSVSVTAADGMTETLQTDNRRVDRRAENGLVRLTQRARWDGRTLVVDINVDNGPRIQRRYEFAAEGTELTITTEMTGRFMGRRPGDSDQPRVLVYERQTT